MTVEQPPYTRSILLDGPGDAWDKHRRYYAQLVTQHIKDEVLRCFGLNRLLSSTDRCFNDIPLARWDRLSKMFYNHHNYRIKLKELGDYDTLAGRVCTLKEAALQIVEEQLSKETK